ncbi:restriction endonuclease [Limosilactobacillus fermentum]
MNSFVAEMGKDYYSSGLLVSSTDQWNRNAEAALENNTKPITRIGLSQLRHALFNWEKFSIC